MKAFVKTNEYEYTLENVIGVHFYNGKLIIVDDHKGQVGYVEYDKESLDAIDGQVTIC